MVTRKSLASAVKWTTISHVVVKGAALATSIVLARLLSPADFGLLAMAMVVVGFVELFADLGTASAIVQRKEVSPELLSSLFWFNLLFGLLATIALAALAPLAALLFREERLTTVMQVLSLTFLATGARSVQQALLQREMLFDRLAKLEITCALIGPLVAIIAATRGAGVWALVLQSLAVNVIMAGLIWVVSPWRPQFKLRWSDVKSVASYSLNLTGFGIFNYFARNADSVLIGRFLGAAELGFYDLAYRLLLYPLNAVSTVVVRVIFPVYSRLQDDNAAFGRAFTKVAAAIALISFPVMFGLMTIAQPFTLTLFGPTWAPMIPVLMILAPLAAVQTIGTTVGTIYQAKGRTDWLLRWGLAAGTLTVASFVFGLQWGIVGVAACYAITSLALAYPGFAIPFHLIKLPMRQFLAPLARPALATAIMVVAVVGVRLALEPSTSGALLLAAMVATGALAYALATWFFNRQQALDLLAALRPGT